MNKRQFLKGMAATAAGILVPGHVLSGQYEFHQRVLGLKSIFSVPSGPIMQDATPQQRTGIISTGVPLAEDGGVSWYGEVPATEFITGANLASQLSFSSGTSQNSDESWLHVGIDGKELMIAKKTIRRGMRYQWLDEHNLIDGQRTINIKGQNYIVRLIKSVSPSISGNLPTNASLLYDPLVSKDSEYNRIFYRLHNGVFANTQDKTATQEPFERLAFYSESDFGFLTANGGSTIVKERSQNSTYVFRRGSNLTFMGFITYFDDAQHNGWRPVLEKI